MGRIMIPLLLLLAASPAAAQDEGSDLETTVSGTVAIEEQTQAQLDAWDKEKADLRARFDSARANVDYLKRRRDLEAEKAQALREAVEELQRRFDEATRLRESLQDTLDAIAGRLESWVERDLPFLPDERAARIETLRRELASPDITGAEKLRRLLESLQVETAYGGTVEVNPQRIEIGGEELFVDVLRLGRVSVFWRTPDGARAGEYDRVARDWVELPPRYIRPIGHAMDMAARIRPVEVVDLPLGRIQP